MNTQCRTERAELVDITKEEKLLIRQLLNKKSGNLPLIFKRRVFALGL
jgi:hypothetical protein